MEESRNGGQGVDTPVSGHQGDQLAVAIPQQGENQADDEHRNAGALKHGAEIACAALDASGEEVAGGNVPRVNRVVETSTATIRPFQASSRV